MQPEHELFLRALRFAMAGKKLPDCPEVAPEQWEQVFCLAGIHQVLPLVYEAAHSQSVLRDTELLRSCRTMTLQRVSLQTAKTAEFLSIYEALREAGAEPLVVKGLVCRSLYPKPDQRPSADEDLLIPEAQFETAHRVLLEQGLTTTVPEDRITLCHEIPYRKPGSGVYIELHRQLFPPESGAYGHLNEWFPDVHSHKVETVIEGIPVLTMCPTEHLSYLICHALKHFLHSGFGIRQVCDMVMLANRHGREIDWTLLLERCRRIRADRFAAALFRIGENYLGLDREKACLPDNWREMAPEEGPMLMDLLASGVHGNADRSRRHSATITLSAAEGQHKGLLSSLFPPAKSLRGRYPYLEKYPVLLPAAWLSRMVQYGKEALISDDSSTAESIRIGAQRVELLKLYRIVDK